MYKVLKTNGQVSGFVVPAAQRNEVLFKSPIFGDKPWGFDKTNSRSKINLINYAVYNNGPAQLRLFETVSEPNQTVFYFVNMCTVHESSVFQMECLERRGYLKEYSPPFNVVTCRCCFLKGHNIRGVTCSRKVAALMFVLTIILALIIVAYDCIQNQLTC